jgi:hypothetical protein
MMKRKPYQTPKIEKIVLVSKEAVLQVASACRMELMTGPLALGCRGTGGGTGTCREQG